MEIEWIQKTITALKSTGITAQRGYASGILPSLTEPLATISIKKTDATSLTLTVLIYTPLSRGGTVCENLALSAAQALREVGAECELGSCSYGGKGGLFSIPVLVKYTQEEAAPAPVTVAQPKVVINGVTVSDVVNVSTGFSSSVVRGKDAQTEQTGMVAAERRWTVTVEDLVGAALSPQETVVDGFTVTVTRSGETETFTGCCWEKISTEVTAAGTRRVRVAITCNEPVVSTTT